MVCFTNPLLKELLETVWRRAGTFNKHSLSVNRLPSANHINRRTTPPAESVGNQKKPSVLLFALLLMK